MAWEIKYDARALKELKKLGHLAQKQILDYMDERIALAEDPRQFGEGLQYDLADYWRYRVGKYRVICYLQDEELVVLVVKVGLRKNVYD